MPFIQAIGSPTSSLKARPLANNQLKAEEIIAVPKGQKLGVIFPYNDKDQAVQAVRLVANATDLGLKAGEIYYAYHKEWLVNSNPWELVKPKKPSIWDGFKPKKKYDPVLKPGDYHLVVIDNESKPYSEMSCLDSTGSVVWQTDCLARGQIADWRVYSGDTPVGLYYLGECWIASRDDVGTTKPYGIHTFDMVSLEDGEDAVGRAGICLHGGGSALGYDACIEDNQKLVPTFGCIRMRNGELRDRIYPMWQRATASGNRIYISVYQL
jgi:hypothetical protein